MERTLDQASSPANLLFGQIADQASIIQEPLYKAEENVKEAVAPFSELTKAQQLHMIMSNVPIFLFALDPAGIFTFSEGQGLQASGYQTADLTGFSVFEIYHDVPKVLSHICRALDGETLSVTDQIGDRVLETRLTPQRDAEGKVSGVIGIATDISEHLKIEEALRKSERRYRALSEQASDIVFILDAAGNYQYISPSHQRILGYSHEGLIGTNIFELIHPADLPRTRATLTEAFQTGGKVVWATCRIHHANGSWVMLECIGLNSLNDPDVEGIIINARDITERAAMEEMLRHQSLHDTLTDLPNRTLLLEKLEQRLLAVGSMGQAEEGTEKEIALLMMDLDRFKEINDTFGHQYGDLLLQQVGIRLRQVVSDTDTVARLGGDEFAILLPTANEAIAQNIANALHIALEKPFTIEGHILQVDASIGVVLYPAHGSDPLTLLRHADIAMYTAKQAHEAYSIYDTAHDRDSTRRLSLIGALRNAIASNQLILYYQPKAQVKSGSIHSVEALVRWQHPTYGFVPPDQFIPLAEQTGLIAPLTRWVLETAVRQCKDWQQAGLDLTIAVNLSMWDLRDKTLPATIAALLEQYGVPPRLLRVELTESAVMTDMEKALDVLKRLSALGVRISVDDFGTGYSSLAYLKRLPVDELKIDRSFVQHMTDVEVDATIVKSTVAMAHSLGMQVVAEGVEDEATWHLLDALDCDMIQGYYLSRPTSAQNLEHWLENWASNWAAKKKDEASLTIQPGA